MTRDEMQALITRVKDKVRVTKVVATRSYKSKSRGDFFAGFAAAWNSVQDDSGGMGSDMDLTVTAEEVSQSGMTLQEARVAQNLVALQADIAAYEAAFANNAITQVELDNAVKSIKANYARLIQRVLVDKEG